MQDVIEDTSSPPFNTHLNRFQSFKTPCGERIYWGLLLWDWYLFASICMPVWHCNLFWQVWQVDLLLCRKFQHAIFW